MAGNVSTGTTSNDRRKFFRLRALLDGKFKTEDGGNGLMRLTDFTREGVRACFNRKVELGKTVAFEIWFPGKVATANASGTVVWLKRNSKAWTGKFDAGVKIEDISPDDRWRILDYAYQYWNQERKKA
ncbi:MAG: PilZ domain-containing protein [PVC group bacterium]|nr:PilZ domain-containing protein [PVC group bacterium]